MAWFGFGPNYIAAIKTLFSDIETCIINNGYTSQYFTPSRGIRQGCCISPYLFLLAAEVLSVRIRGDCSIRGITVGGTECKVTQFADDLTGFACDDSSLQRIIATVRSFGDVSGLTINTRKSVVMPLGTNNSANTEIEGIPVSRTYHTLGVWFSSTYNEAYNYDNNFRPILDRMQECCGSWIHRSLWLKGKVTVLNSLVTSLLQYMCSVTHTPKRVIQEARRITMDYLWDGKRSKIAYPNLIQATDAGGLKLADLDSRVKVNMLLWVSRLASAPNSIPAQFLLHLTDCACTRQLLSYKMKSPPLGTRSAPFYHRMLKVWLEYHSFTPQGEGEYRQEILWNNRFITDGKGAYIHWRRWEATGIHTVNDICHPNEGRLLSHEEINQQFAVPCTFLDSMSAEEWREIYLRPFSTTRETRMQAFQYRLLHRVITCNTLLLRYKIKDHDCCARCSQSDTLEHFFHSCPVNRAFWKLLFAWTLVATGLDLRHLHLKEILLGVPNNHRGAKTINYILLTTRYFIHRQRLFHGGDLCLLHWIKELRGKLLTERNICRAEGKLNKFQHLQTALDYTG